MLAFYFAFTSGIELINKDIKIKLVKNGNNGNELSNIHEIGCLCIRKLNLEMRILKKHIPVMDYVYDPLLTKDEMSYSDEKRTRKIIESLLKNLDPYVNTEYWTNNFKNMIRMLKDKNARSHICDMSKHVVLSPHNILEIFKAITVMYKQMYYVTRHIGDYKISYFTYWSSYDIKKQFNDLYERIEQLPDNVKSKVKIADDMYEIALGSYLYDEFVETYSTLLAMLEPFLETWWADDRLDRFVDLLIDKSSTDYDVLKCFGYINTKTDNHLNHNRQPDTKNGCDGLHHKTPEKMSTKEKNPLRDVDHDKEPEKVNAEEECLLRNASHDKSKETTNFSTRKDNYNLDTAKHGNTKHQTTSINQNPKKRKKVKT